MKMVFREIFSIETDDALRFNFDTLDVIAITEFKEYHGVNVSIMGYLDRTNVPISIDIGFGDVIYPERVKMELPVLLGMGIPEIYAYTIPSVIAENLRQLCNLALPTADPWYTGNFDATYEDVLAGYRGLLEELKKNL